MTFEVEIGGRTRHVDLRGSEVILDGRRVHLDATRFGGVWSLLVGSMDVAAGAAGHGRSYEVAVVAGPARDLTVHVNGRPIAVGMPLAAGRGTGPSAAGRMPGHVEGVRSGPHRVVAPMPGRIVKVLVKAGDPVASRQGLVVIEAMKMENELRSPKAGTVAEIRAVEGERVEAGTLLIVVG